MLRVLEVCLFYNPIELYSSFQFKFCFIKPWIRYEVYRVVVALVRNFVLFNYFLFQGDPRVSGAAHLGGATVGALAWLKHRKGRFGRF